MTLEEFYKIRKEVKSPKIFLVKTIKLFATEMKKATP